MCRDTQSGLQHDQAVLIHVDRDGGIDEANEENKVKVKHWRIPQPGPFSLPACYESASFDPPPCQ